MCGTQDECCSASSKNESFTDSDFIEIKIANERNASEGLPRCAARARGRLTWVIRDYFGVKREERTRPGFAALKKSVLVMDVTQGWIVINENRKLIADIIIMRCGWLGE